ncbi:hypothetical protein GS501_02410 [Saccharibacter sp. 17.LH.SD]|uniref:phage tail assembly protein n=1 Tax=Saccharibacter sp. 17.LH.SD TaxID=2689393 RepID=UPI00136C9C24|nr:phage tail assembly protein [Saccharibacter sp. 17.LH.SD]MXV43905.1 hypothetical protein [Saccharibacter sp. 17.LH.SD]
MMSQTNAQALPPRATLLDDGTVEYALSRPVTIDGLNESLTVLKFREPTAGDLIDAGATGASGAQGLALLASVTGNKSLLGEKLLRALPARDFLAAQKVVAYFFNDGLPTGQ